MQPPFESGVFRLPNRALRLAFFGTPAFARVVLERLIAERSDPVVVVVCQPDRARGRGQSVDVSPVKELALRLGISVVQPAKMKDGVLLHALKDADLDLGIVAAFGRILPEDILSAPRFGCINVHASLLPRHRGASPIQHAILCGDETTGVTLMQMTAGLDEGPMLETAALPVDEMDTAESLSQRLSDLGAKLLVSALGRAQTEGLPITPQDDRAVTWAPLIEKEAGHLNLKDPAVVLARKVRAFFPWPGTWVTTLSGEPLRVLSARPVSEPHALSPGTIVRVGTTIDVATGEGVLRIDSVQPPGKRGMAAADYLRGAGRALVAGMILS